MSIPLSFPALLVSPLLWLSLLSSASAQEMAATFRDGRHLPVEILRWGEAAAPSLRLRFDGAVKDVLLTELIALHGGAPRMAGPAEAWLVGGERVCGKVEAGDEEGETFVIRSPSLGSWTVPVDRLDVLVFRERAGASEIREFRLTEADEALVVQARRGFDVIPGGIYRFAPTGIDFAREGRDKARLYPYAGLAAVSLREGMAREASASVSLLTRTGDLVGVELLGYRDQSFVFKVEGGHEILVRLRDLSALTFAAKGRFFLSDLKPQSTDEQSYFSSDDAVMMPFRRDRSVTGGFLVAGQRAYGKGIGVHSKSVLSYRVPAKVKHFCARVGFDDEVLGLSVRGDVSIVVRLDDEVLFERKMRSGSKPIDLGLLPVRPGAVLALEVGYGKGFDIGDRIDWLSAVFLP